MQLNDHQSDVAIIGGGMAGLAAATYLARSGRQVRLFEQSRALGGRAQTKQHDGFHFNIGPHALYRGGRGIQVLRELGVEPVGKVPSVSGAFAVRDGIKHTFPAGAISLLTTSLFGLSAKLEAGRLLATIGKINARALMNVSLREWLDCNVSHREVQDFILAAFRVATYTNAPELTSAGSAIEQVRKAQEQSVLYLDGGWQTLVEGLRERATEAGVVIETEARVDAVTRNSLGAVEGVRLANGTSFRAGSVLIAASPSVAAALVRSSTSIARWADESIAVKAACLDVALKQLPVPNATFALGIDRPLYFSVHSAAAKLAPDGGALIQVAKYLGPDHSEAAEEVERELEKLLDLIQPGWRNVVVYRRFLPDMIVMNALPLASSGGTLGRPGPEVSDVPGLYVVGDWVGDEGLLVDAALASASKAAEAIATRESPQLTASVFAL